MKKYHKLVENAVRPQGFWGRQMIKSMNKGHSALTDWALSYIEIQPKSIVLDVGCGAETQSQSFAKTLPTARFTALIIRSFVWKNLENLIKKT